MGLPFDVMATGVWPAVPLTGWLLLRRTAEQVRLRRAPAAALMTVVGLAVWSLPLLGCLVLGIYRPQFVGAVGWTVTLVVTAVAWRGRAAAARGRDPATAWDVVLGVGLLIAAAFYLGFPSESIYGGRDEGVYANHAVYMARHGRLDVPYPWPADGHAIFAGVWDAFTGFYATPGTMTVQFGHLFPAWLAQAYATFGHHGLFRLNAVFALLALAVVFDVYQQATDKPYAVLATLFLAFNPSELWTARITLSEIVTQLFTWSGLCLLLHAFKHERPPLAAWAGVCFGFSAMVRFDGLLLLPVLLLAHVAYRFVVAPSARSAAIWRALYATALPIFLLAASYFFVFSRPYFMDRVYLRTLIVTTGGAATLLLASRPAVLTWLRPWLAQRGFLVPVGGAVFALAAYAYWIRPLPTAAPRMVFQWPGFFIDLHKGNYRSDSLVDLARYLSPVVVWAAIVGWYLSLWHLVRTRLESALVIPLVLAAGFSVAYLYNHFNTPDHLWWIRRFVPVVVPAFVLYAAIACRALLARFPAGWSVAAGVTVAVSLAAFTVHVDRLILTFAENRGLFTQLEQLAEKLPAGEPIITHGHKTWVTPLFVAFDRHVVPLDLTSADGQAAWKAWTARRRDGQQRIYLLTELDESGQPVGPDEAVLSRAISEPVVGRLPQKELVVRTRFKVIAVTDPSNVVLAAPVRQHPQR